MSSQPSQGSNGSIGKAEFCRACAQFATGVAVAGVRDASGAAHGMTVNSFSSVSLEPPLVLICISHNASALSHFRQSRHFGISILREDQKGLSERFAEKGRDRFEGEPWCPGVTEAPLIPDALGYIECRLVRVETAGDHDIFIGEVVRTSLNDGRPLIYYGSGYRRLE